MYCWWKQRNNELQQIVILITFFKIFAGLARKIQLAQNHPNHGGTNEHHFKWSSRSCCRWAVGMAPLTVTLLTVSSGNCFYFCIKSLTCFLVGWHHSPCLDRVLQTSAVGLHLPSSHPLVPNCTEVREKENDLSGIYLAQGDEGWAGRGKGGALAHNSRGQPWKHWYETCHSLIS